MTALRSLLARLRHDRSGVALIEFAYTAPLLLLIGMTGGELANLVLTHLRISQAALALADNASRIGTASELAVKQVSEAEINEVIAAIDMQARQLGLMQHGRVILSSLQVNADGGQWIAWQRCKGLKRVSSTFGFAGDGRTGTGFPGMGPASNRIRAVPDSAVMFVEVSYNYQPIFAPGSLAPQTIHYTGAYTVRDKRDLTTLYNPAPSAGVLDCSQYSAT